MSAVATTGTMSPADIEEVFSDFPAFCDLISIRLKAGGLKVFDYEGWFAEQKQFEAERSGRDIVLKPRQVGFSTLELARDLWFAIRHRGVNVLVVAHESDLAEQLFLTLTIFCDCLRELGLLPRTRYSSKREIVFRDSSSAVRIVEAGATTTSASKKGRSGTIHRLHATEVAFWQSPYDTMGGVMQSVPDAGEVVLESTANGEGGLFHETVMAARAETSGSKLHFYPWYQHSEYTAAVRDGFDPKPTGDHEAELRRLGCNDGQIQWWRNKINDPASGGIDRALQDYPYSIDTCFASSGREYYDSETRTYLSHSVRAPLRRAPIQWKGQELGEALIYQNAVPGRKYVVGGEVAEGGEGDGSAAVVLDRRTGRMCAVWRSSKVEPGDFALVMTVLGYMFNIAELGPERNNHGHAVIAVLRKVVKYPKLYRPRDPGTGKAAPGKFGWDTNPATRPILFDELYTACRTKAYDCPDADTASEARTLIVDDDGRPRARDKGKKGGQHDDRMVAWAIAHQMRSAPVWSTKPFKIKGA